MPKDAPCHNLDQLYGSTRDVARVGHPVKKYPRTRLTGDRDVGWVIDEQLDLH